MPGAALPWLPKRCSDWLNVPAEATKQIAAIVKTIQTDTQDAVSAMEQSTQGVVEGPSCPMLPVRRWPKLARCRAIWLT
jgi:hypothetical protein